VGQDGVASGVSELIVNGLEVIEAGHQDDEVAIFSAGSDFEIAAADSRSQSKRAFQKRAGLIKLTSGSTERSGRYRPLLQARF
jgi:hypothetical protein